MTRRPRILDAFCGEGGAGMGYHRAGFDVVGVDLSAKALRRYPFPAVRADAMWFVREHGHQFDAVHLSPPCDRHNDLAHQWKRGHPDLIPAARAAAEASGRPWIMENVEGAPLLDHFTLCGEAFQLGCACNDGAYRPLRRHRLFESNTPLMSPGCACSKRQPVGVYGNGGGGQQSRGYKGDLRESRDAIGVPWMSRAGVSQSIPPAFTEFLGSQLIDRLRAVA